MNVGTGLKPGENEIRTFKARQRDDGSIWFVRLKKHANLQEFPCTQLQGTQVSWGVGASMARRRDETRTDTLCFGDRGRLKFNQRVIAI